MSWDRDADAALKVAHRLWANEQLPGQLAQILPRPTDFAEAMTLVPAEKVGDAITCGSGPDLDGFFAAYQEVLPQLRG
ncbi:MAG: hypothetical protein QOH82_101 [Mycobacterium sp.]|nr:hypothetical protein [Mycobacterium sp.]